MKKSVLHMMGITPLNQHRSKAQRKAERQLKKEMKSSDKKGRENEFMWSPEEQKMVYIPTDDGDIPIQSEINKIKNWKPRANVVPAVDFDKIMPR